MDTVTPLRDLVVGIRGAGDIASAVASRLYQSNIRKIYMTELSEPLAVRRNVSFSEAIYKESHTVEEIVANRVESADGIPAAWSNKSIAVLADPDSTSVKIMQPHVVVDAIIAKKNLATSIGDAPLVIGLGPGFTAKQDVHVVVETNRGHYLGRVITSGCAKPDTGVPGQVEGYTVQRVFRSPTDGVFKTKRSIGDSLERNDVVGTVGTIDVVAEISGILRGLIHSDIDVSKGMKLGDIDPRNEIEYCNTISDKANAIAGSVLEVILQAYNV